MREWRVLRAGVLVLSAVAASAVVAETVTSTTLNDTANRRTFNANGDGPTVGVRGGFVLAEGLMIIR